MSVESHKAKQEIIDEIKSKLDGAQSAVIIDYMGITVAQADEMRKKLREADVDYTVYKNTLMKRAIEGTEFEKLGEVLEGPSGIAIAKEDATAPARVLNNVMKDFEKMQFKAGIIEGKFMGEDEIKEIAKIPSREVLIAKFMGSVQSPISKAVRTLAAIADAKGGEATEAEAPKEEAKPAEAEAKPEEKPTEAEAKPEEKPAEAEAPKEEAKPAEEPAQEAENKTEE